MAIEVRLVNMPFSALNRPSIALSQLKYVVEEEFKDLVRLYICYANHAFSKVIGVDKYNFISDSAPSHVTGLEERGLVFRERGRVLSLIPGLSRVLDLAPTSAEVA